MVLHINEKRRILPFELLLIEGVGMNRTFVSIDQLSDTSIFDEEYVYQVTEYKNLTLHCQSTEESIIVQFDQAYEGTERFQIKTSQKNKVLFDSHIHSYYPWPCGYYMFTVTTKRDVFFGWLKVIPKNFNQSQLLYIHEVLNAQLENLALDIVNDGRSNGNTIHFSKSKQIVQWFEKYERILFSSISFIEQHNRIELTTTYDWEKKPNHQTIHSFKEEVRHPEKKWGQLFYNRKVMKRNTKSGVGFIKHFLSNIVYEFKKMKNTLPQEAEWFKKIDHYEKKCNILLMNPTFVAILSEKQLPLHLMKNSGYQTLYQLERDFKSVVAANRYMLLKPTPILYEYYCFLVVLHVLKSIDFKINQSQLIHQLETYFKNNTIQDGATVVLTNQTQKIAVVFNERIKSHYQLDEKSGFFSQDERRKPDIRLDLYENNQYQHSFIIEVKYRPFQNIFRNQPYYTDTMKQMDRYWLIKRKNEGNEYNYQPIKQIVCLFPSTDPHFGVAHSQVGLFIPLIPQINEQNKITIIGEDLLKAELLKWLQL